MDLEFFTNTPSIVYEKKKYQNFKVTEIGGPEEIIKWRQQQEAKASLYQLRLDTRSQRISTYEKETNQKLESPTIQTKSWEEKKEFAESERIDFKKVMDRVVEYPPWEPIEEKKTVLQRFTGFINRIWSNAGF